MTGRTVGWITQSKYLSVLVAVIIMCNNWHNFLWSIREHNGVVPWTGPHYWDYCVCNVWGVIMWHQGAQQHSNHLTPTKSSGSISVKCWQTADNYQGEAGDLVKGGPARLSQSDGVCDEGGDSHDWQLLLAGLQLAVGGVLWVPGQHQVQLTQLARVEAVLLQELPQSVPDLQYFSFGCCPYSISNASGLHGV